MSTVEFGLIIGGAIVGLGLMFIWAANSSANSDTGLGSLITGLFGLFAGWVLVAVGTLVLLVTGVLWLAS